jgi:hypothetical protein
MSILVGVLEIQEKKDKKSCNPAKLINQTARTTLHFGDGTNKQYTTDGFY